MGNAFTWIAGKPGNTHESCDCGAPQNEFQGYNCGKRVSLFIWAAQRRVGVCITNNPGYAGRTELPENLQSLFRPVSMIKPDFTLIAEVLLFASGFLLASSLAAKLVQVFSIADALLSQQTHYDWGLRAMKTVLQTAGKSTTARRNVCFAVRGVHAVHDRAEVRAFGADHVFPPLPRRSEKESA